MGNVFIPSFSKKTFISLTTFSDFLRLIVITHNEASVVKYLSIQIIFEVLNTFLTSFSYKYFQWYFKYIFLVLNTNLY